MRKYFGILIFVLMLSSCSTTSPLYTWGHYETTSYNYLKNSDEESIKKLIESYKEIIDMQNGSRHAVPPGIFADYGFVLLQEGKTKEGKELLLKEEALYPESKVFIDRILKMIE